MVSAMPVIQVHPDGVKAVKCSGHRSVQPAPARRCISCGAEAPAHLKEGQDLPCGHRICRLNSQRVIFTKKHEQGSCLAHEQIQTVAAKIFQSTLSPNHHHVTQCTILKLI